MSNNNQPRQQESPNKSHPYQYNHPHQDRTYEYPRSAQGYYQTPYPDHKQPHRNTEHFDRMAAYPPPAHYYHPPFNHNHYPYANSYQHNPYHSDPRLHAPPSFYYPPHYPQYPQNQMRFSEGSYRQQQHLIRQRKDEASTEAFKPKNPVRNESKKQPKEVGDKGTKKEWQPQREFRRQYDNESASSRSYISSESESEEEEVYYKRKVIVKRKDPVLDSRQEIRKWIEARKKNYPRRSLAPQESQNTKTSQEQMSLLEKKIRKKLVLINSDPRSIIKKQKDLDILRRFILYPRKPRKIVNRTDRTQGDRPLIEEIEPAPDVEAEPTPEPAKVAAVPEVEEAGTRVVQNQEKASEEEQNEQNEEAVEVPICKNQVVRQVEKTQPAPRGHKQLSVQVIINHLQMKQREDSKLLQNLMDYKSNSCHYRYQHQTLQTNLLLDNVFRDTSYMLQAIRYIVKNNFFQ